MRDLTKAQSENIHAKRRALERLGANLNKENRRILIHSIQNGELLFVRRQSLRVSVFRCNINGHDVDVVYDRKRKRIVTFLFPEIERPYENQTQAGNTQSSQEDDKHLPIAPSETTLSGNPSEKVQG